MNLDEIFEPIKSELDLVKKELDKISNEPQATNSKMILKKYFRTKGKLLRPALLLLSAGAFNALKFNEIKDKLIQGACAIELIHNSSLIHDDIVDKDMFRRGSETLNNLYGSKLAVLVGDALFARALTIMISEFPMDITIKMIEMVKLMSSTELKQLIRKNELASKENYIDLIKQKTGILMSSSCMVGAMLMEEDCNVIARAEEFGLNFGMVYQLIDDYIDEEPILLEIGGLEEIEKYASVAIVALKAVQPSIYKEKLIDLLSYVMGLTHMEQEANIKK